MEQALQTVLGCGPDTAQRIAAKAQARRHPPARVIVRQGDVVAETWLLLDGRARSQHVTAEGRQVPIHDLVPGDLFGALDAMLPEQSAEVVAIEAAFTALMRCTDFPCRVAAPRAGRRRPHQPAAGAGADGRRSGHQPRNRIAGHQCSGTAGHRAPRCRCAGTGRAGPAGGDDRLAFVVVHLVRKTGAHFCAMHSTPPPAAAPDRRRRVRDRPPARSQRPAARCQHEVRRQRLRWRRRRYRAWRRQWPVPC